MVGVAAGDRMVLEIPELFSESDVLGLADPLVEKEQHLVREKRFTDRAQQVFVADCVGEADPTDFGADVSGELLDPHQITKIEEPVVLPASRSRCACTASSSSYRWLISILILPLATWSNSAPASSARSAGFAI